VAEISPFTLTRRAALGSAALAATLGRAGAQGRAGLLTVMQSEAPRSMDPGDHTASFTASVLEPMYDGLVRRNAALKLEPALATEWSSDGSGTVWTFKLRDGVAFHDGAPFDAAAVVHSLSRFLDPKRGLAAAGRVRAVLAGVRAVDARTVECTLKAPYAGFVALLATDTCLIVSPKADAAGTLGRHAVGTGPFRFVEWRSSDYVLEARNPAYWGAKATFEQLKFGWSSEASVLSMALQTGDADVVNPLPPVFAAMVARNPKLRLLQSDGAFVFWVALNTTLKPLDDVRVRQALNYATDRAALVQALLLGRGKPANSPLAPVTPGYDATLDPYPYDVAKAKALLAAAGVGSGFAMSVAVQEQEAQIGEALQGMWSKVGVKLAVDRMEAGVWTKAAFGTPEQKRAQGVGAVIASWSGGAFNADLQLRPLYATASASPAGANLGFFSDPALDRLLDQAAATLDEAARGRLYDEAQKLINTEAPDVLLYYKQDLVAEDAGLSGVWVLPGGTVMVKDAKKA